MRQRHESLSAEIDPAFNRVRYDVNFSQIHRASQGLGHSFVDLLHLLLLPAAHFIPLTLQNVRHE